MSNQVKFFLLLAFPASVLITAGQLVGGYLGLYLALLIALACILISYFYLTEILMYQLSAKKFNLANDLELKKLLEHLSERAMLPLPDVAIIDSKCANICSIGQNPARAVIIFTEGLLQKFNREELAGLISHEFAHIKKQDTLLYSSVAVLSGCIYFLTNIFFLSNKIIFQKGYAGKFKRFFFTFLAWLAAMPVIATISAANEYLADDLGADISGSSLGLASALEKISQLQPEPNCVPVSAAHLFINFPLKEKIFVNLFRVHPPLEERIVRLEEI